MRRIGSMLLVVLVAAARLVYLKWLCPYNLVEDEAFYWEWSRRLEWSYYSKGPGVAWSIADLHGRTSPDKTDVATALSFREHGAAR